MNSTDSPPPSVNPTWRLRQLLAAATFVMVVLSAPLWVEPSDLPRVPFVRGLPTPGPLASRLAFIALLGGVAAAGFRRHWRPGFLVSLVVLGGLILTDQHRFQAWVYQYLAVGTVLAVWPGEFGLNLARLWYAALYFHSGLSKLDASFCQELGRVFLETAARTVGLDPSTWSAAWGNAAVLAMPAGEILTAVLLVVPKTRRLGLAGASALHLALLWVLGPAGVGHSTIVLVWNAAMLAQVWAAFGGTSVDPATRTEVSKPPLWQRLASPPLIMILVASVLLPLGERWGVCDVWPAHALYSSHVERLTVEVHDADRDGLPKSARPHLDLAGEVPWRRLDLNAWSLAARGTPVYPQNRAALGLAEALGVRYGGRAPVRVKVWGPADRWTARRPLTELSGLDEIRQYSAKYRLNSRPAD